MKSSTNELSYVGMYILSPVFSSGNKETYHVRSYYCILLTQRFSFRIHGSAKQLKKPISLVLVPLQRQPLFRCVAVTLSISLSTLSSKQQSDSMAETLDHIHLVLKRCEAMEVGILAVSDIVNKPHFTERSISLERRRIINEY